MIHARPTFVQESAYRYWQRWWRNQLDHSSCRIWRNLRLEKHLRSFRRWSSDWWHSGNLSCFWSRAYYMYQHPPRLCGWLRSNFTRHFLWWSSSPAFSFNVPRSQTHLCTDLNMTPSENPGLLDDLLNSDVVAGIFQGGLFHGYISFDRLGYCDSILEHPSNWAG